MAENLSATCLCGQNVVTIRLLEDLNYPVPVPLCHCHTCRHVTGQLATSYLPVGEPDASALVHMSRYSPIGSPATWLFCSTCGSHLIRTSGRKWEVATGTLSQIDGLAIITSHIHVSDTKDGGLSNWVKAFHEQPLQVYSGSPSPNSMDDVEYIPHRTESSSSPLKNVSNIPIYCHCRGVQYEITPPNEASSLAKSPFPDVMIAEQLQDPSVPNLKNVPWWLQANKTKYLAGTCACRSCRVGSGFEIQTWAFVPKCNIIADGSDEKDSGKLLDFGSSSSSSKSMQSYNSSPGGTYREFCSVCGANIFWHNEEWRPTLVDVSVGLVDSMDGVLALDWLQWWTERVSYEEEPEIDRPSKDSTRVYDLIPSLARGLKQWAERV
jgi:hypothetical protein